MSPVLAQAAAGAQSAVKSLAFLYSLWIRTADNGYMCMIHEHTAVGFFHSLHPNGDRQLLSAPIARGRSVEPVRWVRVAPFAVFLWIIFAPVFFLRELYIEIDRAEEVGWGKRLSRNPGNEEVMSSFPCQPAFLPVEPFTINAKKKKKSTTLAKCLQMSSSLAVYFNSLHFVLQMCQLNRKHVL